MVGFMVKASLPEAAELAQGSGGLEMVGLLLADQQRKQQRRPSLPARLPACQRALSTARRTAFSPANLPSSPRARVYAEENGILTGTDCAATAWHRSCAAVLQTGGLSTTAAASA